MSVVDSAGNKYEVGAIVRLFHFIGTRKRKEFMYKQVTYVDEDKGIVGFKHLPVKDIKPLYDFFLGREQVRKDTVIVQCYYDDHRDLKRNKNMRD